MRSLLFGAGALLLVVGAVIWMLAPREQRLPSGLAGTLVFVSDRHGPEALYSRRLPGGSERRLTAFADDAREPAISPDARRVAFSLDGRIGVVSLETGEIRILTLGIDWHDASPAWLPDGERLIVASRPNPADNADLYLLSPAGPLDAEAQRRPLTETAGLDESQPTVSPDGRHVVFVRRDQVFRLDLEQGRARRLTTGFRSRRHPRFLPSGRIVMLWSAEKRHGIEVMDADGKNLETLVDGTVYYRTIAPSPDGRFLVATFTYDLAFHPAEILRIHQAEEVRLLSVRGEPLATLAGSWRQAHHSPDWSE